MFRPGLHWWLEMGNVLELMPGKMMDSSDVFVALCTQLLIGFCEGFRNMYGSMFTDVQNIKHNQAGCTTFLLCNLTL